MIQMHAICNYSSFMEARRCCDAIYDWCIFNAKLMTTFFVLFLSVCSICLIWIRCSFNFHCLFFLWLSRKSRSHGKIDINIFPFEWIYIFFVLDDFNVYVFIIDYTTCFGIRWKAITLLWNKECINCAVNWFIANF